MRKMVWAIRHAEHCLTIFWGKTYPLSGASIEELFGLNPRLHVRHLIGLQERHPA